MLFQAATPTSLEILYVLMSGHIPGTPFLKEMVVKEVQRRARETLFNLKEVFGLFL